MGAQLKSNLPYREFKNGTRKVVFLHGLMEDARMWTDLLSDLPFHSFAFDLPGYGEAADMHFSEIPAIADKLHKALSKLKISSFTLMGHSLGGYIALEYMHRYPDQVAALGLINSHPFADTAERIEERKKAIDFIRKFGLELYAQQFFPALFAREYKDSLDIHTLSLRATQIRPETIIRSQEAMINRKDRSDTLKKSNIPILWLLGKEDPLVPLDASLELAAQCDRTMIEVLQDVGHMAIFEKRKTAFKILLKFIEFSS